MANTLRVSGAISSPTCFEYARNLTMKPASKPNEVRTDKKRKKNMGHETSMVLILHDNST